MNNKSKLLSLGNSLNIIYNLHTKKIKDSEFRLLLPSQFSNGCSYCNSGTQMATAAGGWYTSIIKELISLFPEVIPTYQHTNVTKVFNNDLRIKGLLIERDYQYLDKLIIQLRSKINASRNNPSLQDTIRLAIEEVKYIRDLQLKFISSDFNELYESVYNNNPLKEVIVNEAKTEVSTPDKSKKSSKKSKYKSNEENN